MWLDEGDYISIVAHWLSDGALKILRYCHGEVICIKLGGADVQRQKQREDCKYQSE